MSIGVVIARARIKAGYKSQRKLSEASGISNATISRIEAGTQRPDPETLRLLSYVLDVPYEELMQAAGYIDTKQPESNSYLESECRRLLAENARLHEEVRNLKAAIKNLTKGW